MKIKDQTCLKKNLITDGNTFIEYNSSGKFLEEFFN